ncbi:hypothetical protein [Planomonospora venezuelensis]|uniref:Uncharacterized protein n=1 Tax=Planomonospora venezuelensis TaxID=1999 RepID=A0A841D5L6_PLAVE|nr:hypothetical protein [Planomonospora venezuelensis]MBB5963794.1 hypothetical protein [Planomonospora venezuelensis]GIM99579.1 hypothetical protein Pve01_12380 [Planomonospora venezuelensis]
MTETPATGYDGLSSRLVPVSGLREFLLDCFGIAGHELFVGHADRVAEDLRDVPQDAVFAAFCTYREVRGHFAMGFDVGVEGRLADRVGRREFIERLAARFGAFVLYGEAEPPGLWTVVLPDGGRLRAAMDEDDDEDDLFTLHAATAPLPGLPEVPVDGGLWRIR